VSSRRRAAWIAAGAVAWVAGIIVIAVWQLSGDNPADADAESSRPGVAASGFVREVKPARAPFDGSTAGSLRVGDEVLKVVVADENDERVQGLRTRKDAAPYDGMVFVFPVDTQRAFTMSTVRGPLDIGFYDANGKRVDKLLMQPCAESESSCPLYRPRAAFRFALETAGGELPAGPLRRPRDRPPS
jgi:uncharacterized membrane protein (UPF0127 family)